MLAMLLSVVYADDKCARFQSLYHALELPVRGQIARMVPDEKRAEEAIQQCWAQVVGAFDRINEMPWESAQGYVAVCARHAALDQLRKAERESREVQMPDNWEPAAPGQEGDEFGRLVAIIRAMPETYREVLELKFVCEWNNKQIARALGLTETAVSTRISRGRVLLIERLKKEGYTYE